MKYSVDRIEENIVILQNIKTGEIKEEYKYNLPEEIYDGAILDYNSDVYILDTTEEETIKERIRSKLEHLKNISN